VVTFAGTDPSGGAGIQADIKAISATGSYAASIITALVAQNTQGVQAIEDVSVAFIQQQIDAVFSDLHVDAIKIGMLHTQDVIDVVANALRTYSIPHVVVDPVMVAKNGSPLLKPELIDYLQQQLLPACTLLTPNMHEAAALLHAPVVTLNDLSHAATTLGQRLQTNVLIKGGHLADKQSSDVLYCAATQQHHWFHADRINSHNTHGTGCTLSSAIASYLAQGHGLIDAITQAKLYLTQAIAAGVNLHIGQGFGPVDHFYFLES
jgi:hydroxymethylpyrimidine/phosphomethylpyrimidine kinase